ncbi:MAG: SecY-interacting protein Syd [Oscillospiraceae bacterium]|nr:SecY-interacting protein Syd [Oscillospiraceae bacterium]
MGMKEAFDIFFQKREDFYRKYKDVDLPVPMKPVLQSASIDFAEIEDKLGFEIHPSIKEYLSTYWFQDIEGFFQYQNMNLFGILSEKEIDKTIEIGFCVGADHYLKENKYWVIGASDPEIIMVNNSTGEVTGVILYEESTEHIADSIEELIKNIECEV